MSVEYSMKICYGVIVKKETVEYLRDYLYEMFEDEFNDIIDEFYDNYCQELDSWAGGDYFIGIIEDLPVTKWDGVYRIDFCISCEKLEKFNTFYKNYDLEDFIPWYQRDKYLINFCHQGLTNNHPYDIMNIEREVRNMKFRGKKNLVEVVTKIVKEFGLEGATLSYREWEYNRITDKIKFTPKVDWTDEVFNDFLADEFDLINPNIFIISLLHEVGHYMTDDDFDVFENLYFWNAKQDNLEKLNATTDEEERKALEYVYFRFPDEYAATEWAVDYYRSNPQKIAKMTAKVNKALCKFNKKNGIIEW